MDDFKMPKVKLGATVYWHGDADEGSPPMLALVTERGEKGINLAIIPPGSYNIQPMSGVPHADDPRVQKLLDRDAGCWQHIAEWEAKQTVPSVPKKEMAKS